MKIELKSILYFICIIVALIINIVLSIKSSKKINKKSILVCTIFETMAIIIGAKILDIVINYNIYVYYFHNNIYKIITNGYTFFGGICAAIIVIYIYSRITKVYFLELCDIFLPNLMLVYAISKIGCYINGCCTGITLNNGYVIPIQLIETFLYFILYISSVYKKDKTKYICIWFGIIRFFVEFLRKTDYALYLSISQILAIFVFIIGISLDKQN